jgi:hypothetical protein
MRLRSMQHYRNFISQLKASDCVCLELINSNLKNKIQPKPNLMKKFITSIFAMAFIATSLQAADIVVDSDGSGDYLTIQAALTAASPGDRIFVVPTVSPYVGDLYINKSIELLSQTEGQRFNYQGQVYINYSNTMPANSVITIQSMHNLNGGISSYYVGTGVRNRVNIVNCKLSQGNINFNHLKYDVRVQNDSLMSGTILIRFGRITGCYINSTGQTSESILINGDENTDDYVYIVGNKIIVANYSWYISGINWSSTTQYFFIANNFITVPNYYPYSIYCVTSKTGMSKDNMILNNTINTTIGSYTYPVYITNSGSPIKIENNLFVGGTYYGYGIFGNNAPLLTAAHNHFHTVFTIPFTSLLNNGTNSVSAQSIDGEGMPTSGTAINGGNPSFSHWDLDNTINDAGCFGGSFSRANFLAASSGARTAFVIAPRRVTVGQPIDIFTEGFDY